MRRLGRYIYNGLTLLSLLICLATVMVWVRSNWYIHYSNRCQQSYQCLVVLDPGEASITFDSNPRRPRNQSDTGYYPVAERDRAMWWVFFGLPGDNIEEPSWHIPGLTFHWASRTYTVHPTTHTRRLTISYWLIVLLTLILPASRIRLRKRPPPGLCPKCRYDLRATPDRCPECGTVVAGAENKRD